MNIDTVKSITQIIFGVAILAMLVVSLFTAYVFIRYGRTPAITVLTTIVFGGVFFLGALSAYLSLTNLFR